MERQRITYMASWAALGACAALGCSQAHPDRGGADVGGSGTHNNLAYVPDFPGAGLSGADEPLQDGMICDFAPRDGHPGTLPATTCFFAPGQTEPEATIEQVLECAEGMDAVHLRLTFDPAFVDNTYGENAIGWDQRVGPGMQGGPGGMAPPPPGGGMAPPPPPPGGMDPMGMGKGKMPKGPGHGGHKWMDLVGSDHAEFSVSNEAGETVARFKLDYISESSDAPSGYASLGVKGGDGKMIIGDAADIVKWSTSIDRNLNERGYASYVVDSPATDKDYTPNSATPNWDYRVQYEVWVDIHAFGESGFGGALIEHVHASPSKAAHDTVDVTPGECPCQRDGGCGDGTPPPPPDKEETCEENPELPNCVLD